MALVGTGYGEVADRPDTFVEPIERAHGNLTALAERVEVLADRLCGPRGPAEGKGAPIAPIAAVTDGIFPKLRERGRDMNRKIDAALDALSRIENSLQ